MQPPHNENIPGKSCQTMLATIELWSYWKDTARE